MNGAVRDPGSVDGHLQAGPAAAFGKYQLFASLGRGGMADVFLAVARGQMGFNKLAVIKRLRQALAEEAAFRTMFLDEARLAARLSHPNIVHTYEVGEQSGVYFIAMEYLEGQSLNKVLKEALRKKEVVEPEIGARIIADALGGLGYAHTLADYDGRPLGIIHRDVSPHNIFVTYDGHTKLVDFGIAKAALSSTETEVGVLKGKVAYMSPEQAMGGRLDPRADIFAMGIVLWELLARQRLMTGESAANTLHKLMNEPIPRLSNAVPGIDAELEAIVQRALEKDPQLRWQSASEMREALEDWLRRQPRQVRSEDVARKMLVLFSSVREEVQRQVQKHMAAITNAANTTELQALTAESLKRMEQSGANVSGQLLRLNGSGSGSGVIPNYGMGTGSNYPRVGASTTSNGNVPNPYSMPPASGGPAPSVPPQERNNNALLIVLAIGFFVLAALLIVTFGFRNRQPLPPAPITETPPPTNTAPPPVQAPPPVDTPTTATTAASALPSAEPIPSAKVSGGKTTGGTSTRSTATHAATPPPPPPVEEKENGFLTINVYPWAKVSEGGKVLCAATPCNKIALSPGSHTLSLENPEQNMHQSTTVTIKSGETTTRAVGFK